MDDLISRQAAIDAIGSKSDEIYKTKQAGATFPHNDFFQGMAYAEDIVKQLPSAQPEIIRCKDCKYRYIDEKFGPSCELDTGDPYATGRNADEDNWFCADAERRTDE